MKTISVIHATVRPEQAVAAFRLWRDRATTSAWDYTFVCDEEGPKVQPDDGFRVQVVRTKGGVHAANAGAASSTGSIIVSIAEDVEPPQGWDQSILDLMDSTKAQVLAVSDGLRPDRLLCHPILTRQRFYDQGSVLVAPEYQESSGIFADNEFTERAYRDGVIVEARHLVFKHNHPVASGQTMDAVMTAHNSEDNYKRGLEIFTRRNPIAGFGNIGYGIRVQQIDNSFFWCWSRQLLWNADHRKLDTVLRPATEWPHAPAMNILLHWFLNSPADSLLSIDDDMEWEPPVIEILRATPGADVVMPLTCCRRAPHNPLVLGEWDLNAGHPTMIDAAVIAKGGIIPVRYVGLGFTLIKRWVLEKLVEKNHGEPPFIFDAFRAEDGKFSEDARAVGAKLAVNTDVRVGHRYTAAAYWNKEEGCVDHSENDYGRSLIIKQRKE